MPSAIKRRTVLRLASAATIFSMLHWPQRVVAASTVRAGGTGSATELLDRISQALKKLHSDFELTVVPGLGSSGGLLATRDNALEFAVISRRLKPDEAALLDDIAIARTPFALATSRPILRTWPAPRSRATFLRRRPNGPTDRPSELFCGQELTATIN